MKVMEPLKETGILTKAVMSVATGVFHDYALFFGQESHKPLQELLVFTAVMFLLSPHETLFRRIMDDPLAMQNVFLPFVANTRDDFKYQTILRFDRQFVRYRCRNCGEVHCIGDCGKISAKRNRDGMNMGGTKCDCGLLVGYQGEENTIRVDREPCRRGVFSTDYEAQKGYVQLEADMVEGLRVRRLSKIFRKIGDFILHSCIMLNFCFSNEFHR